MRTLPTRTRAIRPARAIPPRAHAMRRARHRAASAIADLARGQRRRWNIDSPGAYRRSPQFANSRQPMARARRVAPSKPNRPTWHSAPIRKRSRRIPDQQCHRKRCEKLSRGNLPLNGLLGEAVPPSSARQRQPGITPLARQRHGEARDHGDEILAAAEREQPAKMGSLSHQWLVLALRGKILDAFPPNRQDAGRHPKLRHSGIPLPERVVCTRPVRAPHQLQAVFEIDRPPIVRIDETQVPQFGSLIKIRDARRDHLDQGLRQAVDPARQYQRLDEAFKACDELRRVEYPADEPADFLLEAVVRLMPRSIDFRLAARL